MALLDDAKHPTPARAPLLDNPRRIYGPQRAALTVCKRHGEAYPKDEQCPLCLSYAEARAVLPVPDEDDTYLVDLGAWGDGMWP